MNPDKSYRIAGLFKNYQEYLKSDLWKEKANYIRKPVCEKCHKPSKQKVFDDINRQLHIILLRLDVHHLSYDNVGTEDCKDVITLCQMCHSAEHNIVCEMVLFDEFYNPKKKYMVKIWGYV